MDKKNKVQNVCDVLGVKMDDFWFANDGNIYIIDEKGELYKRQTNQKVYIPNGIQKIMSGEITPIKYWNSDECEDAIMEVGIGHDIILTDSRGDKMQMVWDYGLERYLFLTRLNSRQVEALHKYV